MVVIQGIDFGVLCGNPTNQNSWLYDLYFRKPPSEDYFVVQTSSYDNMYNERGCRGKGFEPSNLLFIS